MIAGRPGETITGRALCPTCATPLALQAGVQVPASPHGLAWRCAVPSCQQWVILTLVAAVTDAHADQRTWHLQVHRMTPTQARIATAPPTPSDAERRGRWILVTFKGGGRVAYGPFGSMAKRDRAFAAWQRDPLVVEVELALRVPDDVERTAVRA